MDMRFSGNVGNNFSQVENCIFKSPGAPAAPAAALAYKILKQVYLKKEGFICDALRTDDSYL